MSPEFDRFAPGYEDLLKDPVREYFAPGARFFAARKIDVLMAFLQNLGVDARQVCWADVGCGKGQLLRAGRSSFAKAIGCDISPGMLRDCADLDVLVQPGPERVPFDDASIDLATAVCVYHHVEPARWAELTADIRRTLKPGGIFAIIEHNPMNPVAQLVVRRTPIDEHAVLLSARRARRLMREAGLDTIGTRYFLLLPERFYRRGARLERALERVPLGGQYAVFGMKPRI
jgi:SAM-dependent methyltransferase